MESNGLKTIETIILLISHHCTLDIPYRAFTVQKCNCLFKFELIKTQKSIEHNNHLRISYPKLIVNHFTKYIYEM